mgnify:FL=1
MTPMPQPKQHHFCVVGEVVDGKVRFFIGDTFPPDSDRPIWDDTNVEWLRVHDGDDAGNDELLMGELMKLITAAWD